MTRVWLRGAEVTSNCEKINFTKGMNSDPSDCNLTLTDLPTFLYNFDRDANDYPVNGLIDPWTMETGNDADVEPLIVSHTMHVYDNSRTKQMISSKGIESCTVGDSIAIKIDPVECVGGTANCFLGIQLNDGTTVGAHLGLVLSTGGVSYSEDDTETTTADMIDTGEKLGLDIDNYLWVKLESTTQFKVGVTSDPNSIPDYSNAFNLANTVTELNKIVIYTPDANDDGGTLVIDYEDFENSTDYPNGHDMSGHDTANGDFGATGAGTTLAIATGVGSSARVKHTNSGASGGDRAFTYAFDTTITSSLAGKSIYVTIRGDGSSYFSWYAYCRADKSDFAYITFNYSGGKIRVNATNVCDYAANTDYDVEIKIVDTTHFQAIINGTTYGGAGGYAWYLGGTADKFGECIIYNWNASGGIAYLDDIGASWMTTSSYTMYPLEAYIKEIRGTNHVEYGLDDDVNIMINDKHSWAGQITRIEKIGNTYNIKAKDVQQGMVDTGCKTNHLHATYTSDGTPADNKITVNENMDVDSGSTGIELAKAQSCRGLGAVIKMNAAMQYYVDDIDSLKAVGEPTFDYTGPVAIGEIASGDYEDTWLGEDEPAYETISWPDFLAAGREFGATYIIARNVGTEVPYELKFEFKGLANFGGYSHTLFWEIWNNSLGRYVQRTTIMSPTPSMAWYPVNLPPTLIGGLATDYCYTNDGKWKVEIRIGVTTGSIAGHVTLMIDKMRVQLVAKDIAHDSVEGIVYNVTPTSNFLYVDTEPFLDNFIVDGDTIQVGTSLNNIMVQATSDAFDSTSIEKLHGWLPQDLRGHTNMEVWKMCAAVAGGYWYWTLNHDSGKKTMHWIPDTVKRRYYNDFFHVKDESIDTAFPEWTRVGTAAAVTFTSGENWYMKLSKSPSTDTVSATLELDAESTQSFETSIRLNTVGTATKPLDIRFLSGTTERFKVSFSTARKPTFTGSAGNSGEIDHEFSNSDYTKLKVTFDGTTAAAFYKDPGDSDWTEFTLDDGATIVGDDIDHFAYEHAGHAVNNTVVQVGYVDIVYSIAITSTSIDARPTTAVVEEAKKVGLVTVFGKNDISWSEVGASGTVREIVLADDGLMTLGAVKSKALSIVNKFGTNTRSIRASPVDADDDYVIGDFYSVSGIDDIILRQAEYDHDWKTGQQTWTLELDTGEPQKKERSGINGIKSDITTTKVANVH